MSRCFCVTDTEKKAEYDKFNEFWENILLPETKQRINDFCEQMQGKYVNEDFAEDVIEENLKSLTYTTLSSDAYDYEIGTLTTEKFFWFGTEVEGEYISSKESLKNFLKNNPKYVLTDEYGTIVKENDIFWKSI